LEFRRETIINDILLYSFAFQTTLTLLYGMDEASRYDGLQGDIGDTMFTRLLRLQLSLQVRCRLVI
jgi:hypothetical protein